MSDAASPQTSLPPRYQTRLDWLRTHGMQVAPLEAYLLGGDEAALADVKKLAAATAGGLNPVAEFPAPEDWEEYDRRAVRICQATGTLQIAAGAWLAKLLLDEKPEQDRTAAAAQALRAAGVAEDEFDRCAIAAISYAAPSAVAGSSLARYCTSIPDARVSGAIKAIAGHELAHLATLFLRRAPQHAPPVIAEARARLGPDHACRILLSSGRAEFKDLAEQYFSEVTDQWERFNIGMLMAKLDCEKYGPRVLESARNMLANDNSIAVEWILDTYGEAVLDDLVSFLQRGGGGQSWEERRRVDVANLIATKFGPKAAPTLVAALDSANLNVQVAALGHLIALSDPAHESTIAAALERGLNETPRTAAKFAALVGRSRLPAFRPLLWDMLGRKQKLLRAAAAEALAANDPEALDRAAALLVEKSKDLRWGAVLVLAKLATPHAVDVLLHRLPREADDEVRNEMTKAVRNAGVSLETIVKALGPIDLDKLRDRGRQMKGMPVKWLKEEELPEVKMLDGQPLDRELVRFLVHRQAWQGEPVPDPEAAPLYTLIDRRTSGDFAWTLLNAIFESGRGKADAWALILAGMLGDNRVITALTSKIRAWADASEQKLGEFGIEALALNGSEAALMAVQSIAEKYKDNPRRKYNVIGTAAQEALELAAKRMGVSMDELGDRIVPALGFEPGRPRLIEAGGRTIEATIGLDFKLSMKDAKTGKKAVSIPKAAPPEVQSEFKGLGKLLVEVAKSQSARLEALMVRQHRWPAPRWEEVFLGHPILFPFAVRLVWGTYDAGGKIVSTFRALPDRTLTDAHDEPVELDRKLSVGIVHPLDLTREQIEAWQTHLGDYEIAPPFLQIERPLVTVPAELREEKTYDRLKGATMNAFSFRGKAERSGWTRGPVGDGGFGASYRKRFAGSGIDAFVVLDDLPYYGYDPSATVTLQQVLFLPRDTKPADFAASMIKLGDVPDMVFSETVGDLIRITGRSESQGSQAGVEDQAPTVSQTV